jgi:hypothetical protein
MTWNSGPCLPTRTVAQTRVLGAACDWGQAAAATRTMAQVTGNPEWALAALGMYGISASLVRVYVHAQERARGEAAW